MVPFFFVLAGCVMLFLLTIGILIRTYLVVVTVENVSMSPTLENGDRVLAVSSWPSRWLRKGYIVLVWPSRTSSNRPRLFEVTPYIKRIVALGGETFTASLNDSTETKPPNQDREWDHHTQKVWHIPQGYIFVRGDNRPSSLDSLSWGPIPVQSVLGVVLMKLPRKDFSAPSFGSLPQKFVPTIGLLAGQDAPPFAAQTLHDEVVTLDNYKGRAVIFLFIAPSDHCRQVIPIYAALAPKAAEVGITMVFVSSTGIQPTRPFVEELHISLPVLIAPRASNSFLREYNISGTPAYCSVNEQGRIQSAGFLSMRSAEHHYCLFSDG
jgi:signal peptidase I